MTIGATKYTLRDVMSQIEPDGKPAAVAELLSQSNQVLEDMPWVEANGATNHVSVIRTGIPDPTWRLLNYGVANSKGTTAQVSDTMGMLEAYAEIDKSVADLNGNTNSFRVNEDRAHIQGMNKAMASTVFYGNNGTEKAKFTGLSPRFNASSAVDTDSGYNIIKGDGAGGDLCTSIWLAVWSPSTVFGIYPKGSKAGLSFQDLGEQTLLDVNGNKFQGYRAHYKWDCGIVVKDWRYLVRIPNIKISALTKNASAGADLIDLMSQALERVQDLDIGTPVFYCNRTIRSFLRRQIMNKVASSTLTMEQVGGKPVMMFGEVPVKRTDALINTESVIA